MTVMKKRQIARCALATILLGLLCSDFVRSETRGGGNGAVFEPPQAPQVQRYQRLWEQSPFTARPVEVVPEAGPLFVEDLRLVGMYGQGGQTVAILQRLSTEEYINVREGDDAGPVRLVGTVGDGPLMSRRVELQAGGETASLGFDLATVIPQPGAGAARAQPAQEEGDDRRRGRRDQAAQQSGGEQQAQQRGRGGRDAAQRQQEAAPRPVPRRRVVLPSD